eukprot:TRINITY_DN83247_c0_g1_i1.p1 TRINITY_DN83247_c0_g1~~TRINITY_DN83247_c0_g1_i1.p1  ORF type:complete len:619 (+),score=84.21 TRINITY_DN83247_c0_g1_i1:25-1881(+)
MAVSVALADVLHLLRNERQLAEDEILNVYQSGSRVYGTAKADSDWDFVIVVRNSAHNAAGGEPEPILEGQINTSLYTEKTFRAMLADHAYQALLCVFLPQHYTWREILPLRAPSPLDLGKIKFHFLRKIGACYSRGKVYAVSGDMPRARKMIVHGFRYSCFGQQLVRQGKIFDYTCANVFFEKLCVENPPETWQELEKLWRQPYVDLCHAAFPDELEANPVDGGRHPLIVDLDKAHRFMASFNMGFVRGKLLEVIRLNVVSREEVAEQFPGFINEYDALRTAFCELCSTIQTVYDTHREVALTDAPRFSALVKELSLPHPGVLYHMARTKTDSVREVFRCEAHRKYVHERLLRTYGRPVQENIRGIFLAGPQVVTDPVAGMPPLSEILAVMGTTLDETIAVYLFGSRVYGCHGPDSDFDFVAIVLDEKFARVALAIRTASGIAEGGFDSGAEEAVVLSGTGETPFDVTVHSMRHFRQLLDQQDVRAFECVCLPPGPFVLHEMLHFEWRVELPVLRTSLSRWANNSWSKGHKKLSFEAHAELVGMKSLFHALRIMAFGLQLARDGRITDYSVANIHWRAICAIGPDWPRLKEALQPEFRKSQSEFRRFAPRTPDSKADD